MSECDLFGYVKSRIDASRTGPIRRCFDHVVKLAPSFPRTNIGNIAREQQFQKNGVGVVATDASPQHAFGLSTDHLVARATDLSNKIANASNTKQLFSMEARVEIKGGLSQLQKRTSQWLASLYPRLVLLARLGVQLCPFALASPASAKRASIRFIRLP